MSEKDIERGSVSLDEILAALETTKVGIVCLTPENLIAPRLNFDAGALLKTPLKDETVDLVYLDPPFKSNQDYNVLVAERDGTEAASQIKAFEDTCSWNQGWLTQ
jgi:16S rRNA G966 N2-methylase RsmD